MGEKIKILPREMHVREQKKESFMLIKKQHHCQLLKESI